MQRIGWQLADGWISSFEIYCLKVGTEMLLSVHIITKIKNSRQIMFEYALLEMSTSANTCLKKKLPKNAPQIESSPAI